MKDALVNIETRRIRKVGDTGTLIATTDRREVVALSDDDAAIVEASEETTYLVDGAVITATQKFTAEQEAEQEAELAAKKAARKQQRWEDGSEEAKRAKISELQLACYSECKEDILIEGVGLFHVDAETLIDLNTIKQLVAEGNSTLLVDGSYPNYKCVDGSLVDIGADEAILIETGIIARKYQNYSIKLVNLQDMVAAATTEDELNAISW